MPCDTPLDVPFEVQQHMWPFIRKLHNHSIRRCPCRLVEATAAVPAQAMESFLEMCDVVSLNGLEARTEFHIFRYKLPFSSVCLQEVYNELSVSLEAKAPLLCVGLVNQSAGQSEIFVLLRAGTYCRLRADMLNVKMHSPCNAYRPNLKREPQIQKRPSLLLECLQMFAAMCSSSFGDLALVRSESWTTESLAAATASSSDTQLLRLFGDAKLTHATERTAFQDALLKSYIILAEIRRRTGSQTSLTTEFSRLKVAEWVHFQYLDHQKCTRLDENSGEELSISLLAYIKDPAYHLAHAIGIFGDNATTGWGKSQVANRFIKSVADTRSDITHEDVIPIVVSNFDGLRRKREQLAKGSPVHFEDSKFSDTTQVQYCSEDFVKASIDVRAGGVIHVRDEDLIFIPETVRVWTANVTSLDEWICGDSKRVPEVSATVRRRMWACFITHRLISDTGKAFLAQTSAESHSTYKRKMGLHFP